MVVSDAIKAATAQDLEVCVRFLPLRLQLLFKASALLQRVRKTCEYGHVTDICCNYKVLVWVGLGYPSHRDQIQAVATAIMHCNS